MDMMFAYNKAKDKAFQLQKERGESDEQFRRRKNRERIRRQRNLNPKSPNYNQLIDEIASAEGTDV